MSVRKRKRVVLMYATVAAVQIAVGAFGPHSYLLVGVLFVVLAVYYAAPLLRRPSDDAD